MPKTLTKAKFNLCFSVFLSDLITESSLLLRWRRYKIYILRQYLFYTLTILQLYYNLLFNITQTCLFLSWDLLKWWGNLKIWKCGNLKMGWWCGIRCKVVKLRSCEGVREFLSQSSRRGIEMIVFLRALRNIGDCEVVKLWRREVEIFFFMKRFFTTLRFVQNDMVLFFTHD